MSRSQEQRQQAARLISVVLVFIAIFQPLHAGVAGAEREVRRVLIINVFDPLSSPGVAELDQGIIASLESSPYQIELYTEDLEMTLFPDEAHQREFRKWYTHKYHGRKPDVIIAVGLEPIRFLALSHKVSFPGTPIVFCGSTEEMLGKLKLDSDFTGVWGQAQPEKTLIAALHLQPNTKHIAVIGGVGAHDRSLESIARKSFRKYESRFDFLYLTDLGMPALLDRLKHLPDETIVYHTSLMQDASGAHFIDATQSVPLIASASKAPVFVVDDVDLGRGTAGGDVLSWASDGRVVGEMAVKVLNGEKPQDIPIAKSANVYMFDWRAMKRWRLDEKKLPPGSILLNRQSTAWESYKWYIVAAVVLVVVETLLILGLIRQRKKRRKSEVQLRDSEERLRLAAQIGKMFAYSWDVVTDVVECSGESADILGVENQQAATGAMASAMVHPDDKDRLEESMAKLSPDNPMLHITYRIVRPDGAVIWVERNSRGYFDGSGELIRMLGMVVDITERTRAKEALAEMTRKLIAAQEQERARIGRELHDDINQRLSMLSVELDRLQKYPPDDYGSIHKLKQEVDEISNDVQALSHDLHASKLDYLGVVEGMKIWCKEFAERQRIEVSFKSDTSISIPLEIGHTLFRVLQEALHNIIKHSGAKRVDLQLWGDSSEIHLLITDPGKGFNVEQAFQGRGLGLWSMRERVRLVNGTLSIESKPASGTKIHVDVPLAAEDSRASLAG